MKFELSEKQQIKVKQWVKKHRLNCNIWDDNALGQQFIYTFIPGGLGDCVTVQCFCGHELDVTDYETW